MFTPHDQSIKARPPSPRRQSPLNYIFVIFVTMRRCPRDPSHPPLCIDRLSAGVRLGYVTDSPVGRSYVTFGGKRNQLFVPVTTS